mgnify:CR=1 FL=1
MGVLGHKPLLGVPLGADQARLLLRAMADPLRLGFRSGLDPEAQHSLQRAEPIRWFREGEARTRRAVESNDDEMETEA